MFKSLRVPVPLLLTWCVAALPACSPTGGGGSFSDALANRLQVERAAEVDLATVGNFAWDELFALGPSSTRDDNCRLMAMEFLECRTTVPASVAESEYFLVFRARGKVVRAERHLRSHGDFDGPGASLPRPLLRTAARFKVVSDGPVVRLEHLSQ